MSFLFSLSPFRGTSADIQSQASSSSSSQTTPPNAGHRNGRRELTRQDPHESLRSPFVTPSKAAPPVRASNGKIGLLERHLLPNQLHLNHDDDEDDRRSNETHSDEGCFLSDAEDDVTTTKPLDFIRKLPHELAVLVLINLPTHHSLLVCGSVSRTWRSVAQDTLVWRDFFHRNPGWRLKSDTQVNFFLSHLSGDLLLKLDTTSDPFTLRSLSAGLENEPSTPAAAATSPTSPATPNWWKSPASRAHDLMPSSASTSSMIAHRHIDRLDWASVYAARYQLARRWGEVVPGRPCEACEGLAIRDRRRADAFNRRTASVINEDWDDTEDDDSEIDIDFDSSDEEAVARFHVQLEARRARDGASPIGDIRRTMTSLMKMPKRWLPRIDPPEVRVFGSHQDYIYCVRTYPSYTLQAPSAGYIVTGSRDRTIRVWDVESGQCLHVLRGHSRSILSMDVCSEGDILVSGASDQMLGIWVWFGSAEAAEARRRGHLFEPYLIDKWDCHTTVMDVRLSDRYMVLGFRNGQVRCYQRTNKRTFKRLSVYHGHESSVNDLSIQGDYVAVGYAAGALEVIDILTGTVYRKFVHNKGVACVGFSGDLLAAGASDFVIRCWRVSTGQLLLTLRGHTELPRSIRFDSERGLLLSAGYDGRVNIWDVSLLLGHEAVDGIALGQDWRVQAVFYRKDRLRAERDQARTALFQEQMRQGSVTRRSGSGGAGDDGDGASSSALSLRDATRDSSPPAPHPLHDPPIAYRPRFSFRDKPAARVPDAEQQQQQQAPQQQGQGGAAQAEANDAQPVAQVQRGSRLFDAAFDGKRIISVGESHTFAVREFLTEKERFDLKWEIFG